jgi:hypothetical protein
MNPYLWWAEVAAALLILLGILAVLVVVKRRREGRQVKINYYLFYILGIVFIPLGLVLMYGIDFAFIGLVVLGVIYVAIGLAHRRQWR